MSIRKYKNRGPSWALLLLGLAAVAMFIGSPTLDDNPDFSEVELQLAEEIGQDIAAMMGQITITPEICPEVVAKLPSYIDKKLFSMEAESFEHSDLKEISDLPAGIQWIFAKCDEFKTAK
jgi:hypothetical protein